MIRDNRKKVGAVLVQGAGIAGVQAALDLANSGLKVYLLERSDAIGGMMARLDKTFPTGDCATCIVSPKLVECARNLNVEILTLSELVDLEGEPGRFKARVRKRPRYIDEDKCTACGDCTRACPVDIPDRFNRELGKRKAAAKAHPQAIPNVYGISKLGHAPCKVACPANINVQGYVQLIKKKEYLKAVELIRQRNPLSAIFGRVCTHPCETACTRAKADEAVAIRQLKRFASDREMEMVRSGELQMPPEQTPAAEAKRVAVIGAGPAGLTAADDLAKAGFAPTVYEASSAAGGMLRWGIPEYRLPANVLDYEVELIRRHGVVFRYGCTVGRDVTMDQLRKDHDAVFIAVGVQKGRSLGVQGRDLPGVVQGIDFLRQAAGEGGSAAVEGRVVVIGGGNVAVDVARTALRLGAAGVEMVALEQRRQMPAYDEEIEATVAEGIVIHNGWGPAAILGNGRVAGIELKRCTSVFGYDGRFNPVFAEQDRKTLAADRIIVAIGQAGDEELFGHIGVETDRGRLVADPVTLETSMKGVFAGGDVVSGPAAVIDAVAAGKRAAESIGRYLRNEDRRTGRFEESIRPVADDMLPRMKDVAKAPRSQCAELAVDKRRDNFDEVELSLSEEAALAEAERCLNCALCSECNECALACVHKAIDHGMKEETVELDVGAVILAPGFDEFAAEAKGEYGFGRYANVMTSVQFERMLSAAGPFEGHVVRLSDGRPARRIAWIQCVGSRDSRCGNDYCSSVCCMATTKQAMVALDHSPDLEATIFYMDIRAHGKDFDAYYERARAHPSIHYLKAMPSRIIELPAGRDLRIRYLDGSGGMAEQEFDLVVLSVGMEPSASVVRQAGRLGVELDDYGFCRSDRLRPLETSRPGVFAAGAFQEPKDIPETVTQAGGAAAMAMELLADARGTLVTKKSYPPERDITDEAPRIGVFVCHCGINIASVVDVERVAEAVRDEPDVIMTTHTLFTCADSSLSTMRDLIAEHRLNRIVVASCTPRTHEPIFRDTLREAGLNPYLFELANIRDQCSWVHSREPDAATQKAVELVRMSIARARGLRPLEGSVLAVDPKAIVIGGGLAGMTAAMSLAEQGFTVNLIERAAEPGGHLSEIHRTLEHDDISGFVADLKAAVRDHRNIRMHLNTRVADVKGHIGKFHVTLEGNGRRAEITGGAIIVATGAAGAETTQYLYGQNSNVMTQNELEKALHDGAFDAKGANVVMIQCVSSRNDERPYCSRICCSAAIKNALGVKRTNPDANVYVLYRDIRTYGMRELYYKKAREAGVVFLRYDRDAPPVVSQNDALVVKLDSPDLPESVEIETDKLILSTGIVAEADNKRVSDMLKVPLNGDGFFLEAHVKLRPVDFATEGVFLCGLAHSPKAMDENISQARAAAARAATVLSKKQLDVSAQVSFVRQDKCISCMTCVRTCPYGAPFCNDDGKGQIEAAKCMGCGICASECPARAIQLRHFETDRFEAMIDQLVAAVAQDERAQERGQHT